MTIPKKTSKTDVIGLVSIFSIILLVFLLGILVSFKKESVEADKKNSIRKNETAINVVTLKLAPKPIMDRINLPGVVEPWVQLDVSTEVAGRVLEKKIVEGSSIMKGDIIAIVDSSNYLNTYKAAKSSYDSSLASKKRHINLYNSKLSSKSELDTATANTADKEAAMKIAALDLEKCKIKAPISGIINRIHIEEGQFINTGTPVAELIQIDTVKVNVGIPESDVSAVRNLKDFQVKFDGLKGKIFNAKKHYLSKTTSSLARLYDLEIAIDNVDNEILPGMFGRIEIVKQKIDAAVSVPLFAITSSGDKKIVYVAQENQQYEILDAAFKYWGIDKTPPKDKAQVKVVKTGIQQGWMVQITEGLDEGDEVIVAGQRNMSEQQKIKIIKTVNNPEELVL